MQQVVNPYSNRLDVIGIVTFYKERDPTTADNTFRIPSLWINTASLSSWILIDNTNGASTWLEVGAIGTPTHFIDFYDATSAPPGAPSDNDSYVLDTATPVNAAWTAAGATNDDYVEWSGSAWLVRTPNQGDILYNETDTDFFIYTGTVWELLSGTISGLTYTYQTRMPRTTDNTYVVPTLWLDTTANKSWLLADVTTGVATWLKMGASTLGDAQDSVLARTDGNNAPPTEVAGNRYIIYDGGGGVVHADWDGASFNDICEFDGATWVARTPSEGTFTEVEDEDTVYIFITAWEKLFESTGATFGTDSGNAVPDATGAINFVGNATQGLTSSGATNIVTFTIADATETQKGVGETSTDAEAIAVTALDKFLVPGNMTPLFASPPAIGGTAPNTAKFTYMDLVGAAAPAHNAGRLFYDSSADTLSFYNAETEVALNIGEENWVKVRNETGSTITNGNIVYLSGSSSGFPLIVKAIATSESSSMVIGVVTHDIENNSNGYVTTFGLVRGLNTAAFSGGDIIYLSDTVAGSITTTKPDSKTEFVVRIGVIGAVDASVGTFHVNICCGGSLSDINSYTFNPNGFDDPSSEVTTSFVNATRTLTIAPQVSTFTYWSEGVAYKKSASEDIIIPDTEGAHYIYYNGSTLSQSTTWSLDYITKYALVEILYWDAANNVQIYFGDEFFHGTKMGSMTHGYLHDTRGFSLESGAGLTDILEDESGALDSHAEFGVEATIVYDEDAEFSHSAKGSTANIPVYYKTNTEGSPYWRTDETASFGVLTTGTGRAAFNELTGGNWVQTEVPNNDFVLAHVFTYNDSTRKYGVIQGESSYNTIISARDGAITEINAITIDGLIGPEIKFIGTVIYQTSTGYANTVKSRIRSTDTGDEYVDLRDFPFTRGGVSGTLTDHGALTGLGDDDHLQYVLADGSRTMASLTLTAALTVPNGGSGLQTAADGGILLGSGVGAFTVTARPGSGELLIGSVGADPVLGSITGTANQITMTPGAGSITLSLPQDIGISSNVAFGTITGTTGILTQLDINIGASGDPKIVFDINGTDEFYIGVDDDDSDKFKIGTGAAVGTNTAFEIDSAGHVTMPLQSAFCAFDAGVLNVTGNNTMYTLVSAVERFDLNNDYVTGTYTSPVTSYVHLGMDIVLGAANGGSNYYGQIVTSNKTYSVLEGSDTSTGGYIHINGATFSDMDAADTATFQVRINGIGADTADISNESYVYGKIGC